MKRERKSLYMCYAVDGVEVPGIGTLSGLFGFDIGKGEHAGRAGSGSGFGLLPFGDQMPIGCGTFAQT